VADLLEEALGATSFEGFAARQRNRLGVLARRGGR